MRTLQHQTALIICSATGQGPAIAERFAALGAQIILHANDADGSVQRLISNIRAMGSKVRTIDPLDVTGTDAGSIFSKLGEQAGKTNIIVIENDHLSAQASELLLGSARHVADHGRIIFVDPKPDQQALEHDQDLMQTLALQFAERHLTVNAIIIAPGENEIFDRPTGPEDIADAAEFFASDLSALVTGQCLVVNGTFNK